MKAARALARAAAWAGAAILASSLYGQSWYNAAWQYRKCFAVDHRKVFEDGPYPLWVAMENDADLKAHAKGDGSDIVFTAGDGTTKLPRILVKYAGGTLMARVQRTLSTTADTTTCVYYGNAAAQESDNPAVWDSHFKAVWEGGSMTDATSGGNNLTAVGTPVAEPSPWGSAFRFNGSSHYLTRATTPAVSTAYTAEAWVNGESLTASAAWPGTTVFASANSFEWLWDFIDYSRGGPYHNKGASWAAPAPYYVYKTYGGTWHHVAMVWDGATVDAYIDGAWRASAAATTLYTRGAWTIGGFRGAVGTVTLSDSARSKAWLTTQYYNEKDPATFYQAGAEQSSGAAAGIEYFTASYTSVEAGHPTVLRWLARNTASASIDQGVGPQGGLPAGSVTVNPTVTTTYTLTVNGGAAAQVTVTVLSGPVVYARHGGPAGTYITGYTNTTPPVMETGEPHMLVAGDVVFQQNIAANVPAKRYVSNLNGNFSVKQVIDAGHYTITDLAGHDVTPNGDYHSGEYLGPSTAGSGQFGPKWAGRAVPYGLVAGPRVDFAGWNDGVLRKIALGTHNGLVSLTVTGGVATATTSFTHDVRVGDRVSVWNTTSAALNGERTVTAATATTYSFATGAANGNYTNNNACGASGTENCVRLSLYAVSTNTPWTEILGAAPVTSVTTYYHLFDGGTASSGWSTMPYAAVYRYLVDPSQTVLRDALIYYVTHMPRIAGVNWSVYEGAKIDAGPLDPNYASTIYFVAGLAYTLVRDYLTPAQRQAFADQMLNSIEDVDAQCTPTHPMRWAVSKPGPRALRVDQLPGGAAYSGTAVARGGSSNTILLDAADQRADGYWVNTTVMFAKGSPLRDYYGLITAYNGTTNTATVGTVYSWYAGTNGGQTSGSTWPAPDSATAYVILATGSRSGNTVTGYQASFLSSVQAGYGITAGNSYNAIGFPTYTGYVSSVQSDSTLTILPWDPARQDLTGTPQPLWLIRPWQTGDCGFDWFERHWVGAYNAQPVQYPPQGGFAMASSTTQKPARASNNAYFYARAMLGLGLALADDDPRAARLIEQAQTYSWDGGLSFVLGYNNGFTVDGVHYGFYVLNHANALFKSLEALKGFQPLEGISSDYLDNYAYLKMHRMLPDYSGGSRVPLVWGGNNSHWIIDDAGGVNSMVVDYGLYYNPESEASKYLRNWMQALAWPNSTGGGTDRFLNLDPRLYPQADYTKQPLEHLFTNRNAAACQRLTGWDCSTAWATAVTSRTSWTNPSATVALFQSRSWFAVEYDAPEPGTLYVYKAGHLLSRDSIPVGQGSYSGDDVTSKGDAIQFNGTNTLRGSMLEPSLSRITRYAGTDDYVYALSENGGAYVQRYNRVNRHLAHFKKGAEVFIRFDDVDTSNGSGSGATTGGILTHVHYTQNQQARNLANGITYTEGDTTCVSCNETITGGANPGGYIVSQEDGAPADSLGPARTNGVVTKFFSPGTITVRWDGQYSGGAGNTKRVSVCAGAACGTSATSMELITVHKITTSMSDVTMSAKALNPDTNWTGVQAGDKVALFARKGAQPLTVTFATNHPGAGQYLIAGLAGGRGYGAARTADGSDVMVPQAAPDDSQTVYFEAPAGSYTVFAEGLRKLALAGLMLARVEKGAAYQFDFSVAGAEKYQWSVSAGTLAPGLSLSAAGMLSGTPTAEGDYTVTIQARDAADASLAASAQVALHVWPAPSPLTVTASGTTTSGAVLAYGRKGMDALQSCTVDISSEADFTGIVESYTDAGGAAVRPYVAGGTAPLDPGAVYYARARCGTEQSTGQFETRPFSEERPVTVGLLIAPVPGATTVELQYGSTADLGQTVSAACEDGCRVEVAATAGTLLYTKRVFRDGASEVVALSRTIAVAVR